MRGTLFRLVGSRAYFVEFKFAEIRKIRKICKNSQKFVKTFGEF